VLQDTEEGRETEQIKDDVIVGGEKDHKKKSGGRGESEEMEIGGDSKNGTKEIRSGEQDKRTSSTSSKRGAQIEIEESREGIDTSEVESAKENRY